MNKMIANVRLLSLISGCILVTFWTFLRFFRFNLNFDLVGQLGLAQQWLTVTPEGAMIGPTNYLIKLFFVYIPTVTTPGSPLLKLVFITVVINVATYILSVILLEKLWQELTDRRPPKVFYLAVIWLSLLAGSIYWVQFSNSRNLEVVGGLLAFLFGLRLLHSKSKKLLLLFVLFLSILFFADPLQIYMTIVPLLIVCFVFKFLRVDKTIHWNSVGKVSIGVLAGLVLSQLWLHCAKSILGIRFIEATTQPLSFNSVMHGAKLVPRSMIHVFFGGIELGKPVGVLNILIVGTILSFALFYLFKKQIVWRQKLTIAIVTVAIVNVSVYVLSGQSAISGTSRYLIMLAPFYALLMTEVLRIRHKSQKSLIIFIVVAAGINTLSLSYAFLRTWDANFQVNNHLYAVESYLRDKQYSYGYASMDTSMPVNYLSNQKAKLLALECLPNNSVRQHYLFFDRAFADSLTMGIEDDAVVPIVLDGSTIGNHPWTCKESNLKKQLGEPIKIERLSDHSIVLIYKHSDIQSRVPQ